MSEAVDAEIIEEADNLPAVVQHEAIMARGELTVAEIVAQKDKILQIMQAVMKQDVHYGVIPGVGKPSLFKPGAEAINVALRLAPDYESEKIWDGNHLTVSAKCTLRHIPTGLVIASGEGLCSSRESKYATRKAKRQCPACGAQAIIKGKAEYGGGWLCWKKADPPGCGAKYADGDPAIESQAEGSVENPDLPDIWNTVLKMADKRALIAAVLNGTAASDVFTQDVEDSRAESTPEPARSENVRSETASAFPLPKTWPDIEHDVRLADNPDEAWALFQAFLRAATYHLYGQTSLKDITAAERKLMLQKASGAVVWLHDNTPTEGEFLFFYEAQQRKAWKHVTGEDLAIPDYQPPEPPGAEETLRELAEDA